MRRAILMASVLACMASFGSPTPAQTGRTDELVARQKTFDEQMTKIGEEAAAALRAWPVAYLKELDALQLNPAPSRHPLFVTKFTRLRSLLYGNSGSGIPLDSVKVGMPVKHPGK